MMHIDNKIGINGQDKKDDERTILDRGKSLALKKVMLVQSLWNSGRITKNEMRTLMEMKTIEGGDVYKITIKK